MKYAKVKRCLSCGLAFLLAAELAFGTGISTKAAEPNEQITEARQIVDATKIQAKITDNKGKALANIACELVDTSASDEHIATLVSDQDGLVEYSLKDLQSGTYKLSIPFDGTYTIKPSKGYTFSVEDGKIVKVDGDSFTGEETIEFTLTSINDTDTETPQPDQKTMIVQVTDQYGNAFNEQVFVVVDSQFPTSEGMAKRPTNGILKVTVDAGVESGEIRIASSQKANYTSNPEKITFTAKNQEILTVNGEKYDGTQTFSMKVTKNEVSSEDKATITRLNIDESKLPATGGNVALEVLGKNLKASLLNVNVYASNGSGNLTAVSTQDEETVQKYTIDVPANDTTENIEYVIACAVKGDVLSTLTTSFVVEGKEEQKPEDITSNAVITSVKATPEQVTSGGGNVKLEITGEDLTANNWGVKATAYIAGTDVPMADRLQVKVSDLTAEGAVITIPSNTLKNVIEYRIEVGALRENGIEAQATTTVQQEKKGDTVAINPKSVEMVDSLTLVATMEQNVTLGSEDMETVKNKIFIADFGNEHSNRIDLTENDTVTTEGNLLKITFENVPTLKSTSALFVEEGALKSTAGVNLKKFSWIVVSKAMITGIELKKEIFDAQGGLVRGILKGVSLEEADNITAKIFKAGIAKATDIPVSIGQGAEPTISFELPANETELTESYIINLTMGDTPVYVSSVVSVLASGMTETEQTLSAMTITGNNKLSENENSTEITVKVSKQVGELKTRLNLYGTNLDSTKTEVRAIDQNGVIWPVNHVPE